MVAEGQPAWVACFCGTSVAADLLARGHLPLGRSRQESELLLQQTAEAMAAKLEVRGCFDIRPAVEAAAEGQCLTAKQLQGVATTLEAALSLVAAVKATAPPAGGGDGGGGGALQPGRGAAFLYPTLAALAGDVGEEERALLRALQTCIQQYGAVTDAASEALAAVRADRAANREALRAEVDKWYRALLAKGAVEQGGVRSVRGRTCLGVRAGRQGDLPKGSVRLGASSSGATLYIEPQPAVALNNAEAVLAEREERATLEVLAMLSRLLGDRRETLLSLVAVFTALDVVAARARHAAWLSGVRPHFVDESSDLLLHVPGALHPVLMQRGLPPLPQPPSVDDNRFDRDFQAAPAWEVRRVLQPEGPASGLAAGAAGSGDPASGAASSPAGLLPRPLDLRVPAGKAVVAITGPNTGGKTVTIKAAGLMALMAKAGLFLPCDPRVGEREADGAGPEAGAAPRLAWFDRVLADIGDSQSLQQSLSTFSGHIRRIKQILAVAGPGSLVLLDEVGSGTDPLEGAALARAVLDRLAAQARLTLATTHHAELKAAADEDARFVNVSMAFDTASLRPTYSLRWGAAGASNALDIAETLGFDRSVVQDARAVAAAMAAAAAASRGGGSGSGGAPSWRESQVAGVARSLVAQLEETRAELEATRERRERRVADQEDIKAMIEDAQAMEAQLNLAIQEVRHGPASAMERLSLGDQVTVRFESNAMFGSRAGRAVKVRRREVRKVRIAVPFGTSGLASVAAAVSEFDSRVTEVLERERGRQASPYSSTIRKAMEGAASDGGAVSYASYADVAAELEAEVELTVAGADEDYGSEELNSLVRVLDGDDDDGGREEEEGWRRRQQQQRASSSSSSRGRGGGAGAAAAAGPGGAGTGRPVPQQTASNTVDVAGEIPELAAADVDDFLRGVAPGGAFFVRTGTGTGAVRAAVHELLGRRRVAAFHEVPGSRGEVTVVFV
ncbi:hypothetical protein GPECTOR_25g388 [Gonium pectorale]|uniref:DNA mismatch repair proteins mutS family domain-containing protein n=1 Tax=Gonium pectorale TaxID=33097 RepID=A0A150GG61_GONPE|nr:hypothetical protein GPECTOR_25g388 [Gonium pectorale]|eukprot:KXZ48804.1 hypothetical protein GPECTOR_25g388 [Gonium pectorale]